jgi:hypothetical protein
MNLLERAKARGSKVRDTPPRKVTRDEVELAIAWLKGEVTYCAVVRVMKLTSDSNVYGFIAIGLREAYKQNRVTAI